jgi:hypothetical protein
MLFQMMGYGAGNKFLLHCHHLIFESGLQAKNEWISLWELTHFLNAFHPAPKTITFEGRIVMAIYFENISPVEIYSQTNLIPLH